MDEVSRLLEQGKAPQAAKQAEAYLKQNPADVQMRFLQGVIAAEQRQNAQAIKIFTALTRDYPSLPRPTTTWPCCTLPKARNARPGSAGAGHSHQPQLRHGA